jgi:hypothetical protein
MTVMMHVFRPNSSSYTWSVSTAISVKDNTASAFPFSPQISTIIGDLMFACVITNDDNTLSNNSGGNMTTAGSVQYRNLQGQDCAMGAQYRVEAIIAQGLSGDWSEATLGNDTYAAFSINFHQTAGAAPVTFCYGYVVE